MGPYAGPKQGRMGSDRNYQQIPHRKQYHIPKMKLPDATGNHCIWVSHGVDHGDLAFIVRAPRQLMDNAYNIRFNTPVFCNVATANYLLAGIQIFLRDPANLTKRSNAWYQLIDEMAPGKLGSMLANLANTIFVTQEILRVITTHKIIPYGICAGSEKQGGQTEMTLGPVHGVASHMSTLTIDGQNRDLVNIWGGEDISAGDILCLGLQEMHVEHYTLNHYYKGVSSASFNPTPGILQIVPRVETVHFLIKACTTTHLSYWKIAQSMQHVQSKKPIDFEKLDTRAESSNFKINDDMSNLRADIVQVLFSPVLIYWEVFTGKDIVDVNMGSEDITDIYRRKTQYMTELRGTFLHMRDRLEHYTGEREILENPHPHAEEVVQYVQHITAPPLTQRERVVAQRQSTSAPSQAATEAEVAAVAAVPAPEEPQHPRKKKIRITSEPDLS